jgi:hypothetical protein
MKTFLVAENYAGNLYRVTATLNRRELVDYVFTMHTISGDRATVVFRIPLEEQESEPEAVKALRAYGVPT